MVVTTNVTKREDFKVKNKCKTLRTKQNTQLATKEERSVMQVIACTLIKKILL